MRIYTPQQTSNLNELLEQATEALVQKYKREGMLRASDNVRGEFKIWLQNF